MDIEDKLKQNEVKVYLILYYSLPHYGVNLSLFQLCEDSKCTSRQQHVPVHD